MNKIILFSRFLHSLMGHLLGSNCVNSLLFGLLIGYLTSVAQANYGDPNPDPLNILGRIDHPRITVYPTGDPFKDPVNVQWAVDNVASKGTVMLKATDRSLDPQYFDFGGNTSVTINNDVTIKGEDGDIPLPSYHYEYLVYGPIYEVSSTTASKTVIYRGGMDIGWAMWGVFNVCESRLMYLWPYGSVGRNQYIEKHEIRIENVWCEYPRGAIITGNKTQGISVVDCVARYSRPVYVITIPYTNYKQPLNGGLVTLTCAGDFFYNLFGYPSHSDLSDAEVLVENCETYACGPAVYVVDNYEGSSPSKVAIRNNVFSQLPFGGHTIAGIATDLTEFAIEKNIFRQGDPLELTGMHEFPIEVGGSTHFFTGRSGPIVIKDNTIEACQFGIAAGSVYGLDGGFPLLIEGNQITQVATGEETAAPVGIIQIAGTLGGAEISNNLLFVADWSGISVTDRAYFGAYSSSTGNINIVNNTINGTGQYGILVENINNFNIINNKLQGSAFDEVGILLSTTDEFGGNEYCHEGFVANNTIGPLSIAASSFGLEDTRLAGIVSNAVDMVIIGNDFKSSGLPGWNSDGSGGPGCVWLREISANNLVHEWRFPSGTCLCQQVLDQGSISNEIKQWDKKCTE